MIIALLFYLLVFLLLFALVAVALGVVLDIGTYGGGAFGNKDKVQSYYRQT